MRRIRKLFMAAAVLAAAFLLLLLAIRPSPAVVLPDASWQRNTLTGAFHIHTNRSDGSGSPDQIAAAAAAAGLQFVILTDHGDGTRMPDPPQYRAGVLCLDSVEISTSNGHYIAVGLSQTPYPLGGEARDVVEDVSRLGGFGVVAHPDSQNPALKWFEWTAPFEAMEWLNADSEWRDEPRRDVGQALLRYPFRPAETLGSFLDRPEQTLQRWDALTQRRKVVAFAGADAHARAGWRDDDDVNGYREGWFLRVPSYEASFRAFKLRVMLDAPLSGKATSDASRLVQALRAGHVYSGIDAIATPASLDFSASREGQSVDQGGSLEPGAPVTLRARTNAQNAGKIVIRRNGQVAAQGPLPDLQFPAPQGSGVYRAEVQLDGAPGQPPVPWIVSNPIYIEPSGWGQPLQAQYPEATYTFSVQGGPWHVEKDESSTGAVRQDNAPTGPVSLEFKLAPGTRAGQHVALVVAVGRALEARTRFRFHAGASQPMRISLQVRKPSSGERWQRSIYLDPTVKEIVIPFKDMTPVGHSTFKFDPKEIDTVLLVIDTTNTTPGNAGSFTLHDLRVQTEAPR